MLKNGKRARWKGPASGRREGKRGHGDGGKGGAKG
jgi:hypothetical protein